MPEWSKSNGRGQRYVRVDAYEVVVGEHFGSGHSDNAGTCSHAEFLAGRFQDLIRDDHSARTLAEVVAAVRGAGEAAEFQRARAEGTGLAAAWAAIPEDPSLTALLKSVDDRGMDHYGGGGEPIAVSWAGRVWSCWQQSVRVTAGDAVVFEVDPVRNRWGLASDVRIGDVLRCGDRVLVRYSSPFSGHGPLRSVIGRTGLVELRVPGGLVARATITP